MTEVLVDGEWVESTPLPCGQTWCSICEGVHNSESPGEVRQGVPTAFDRLVIHPSRLESL